MIKQEKQLIILRPLKSSEDNLRLGLYTDKFRELVDNRVTSLCVDFGNGLIDVEYLTTYINHGSIVGKESVNGWLQEKGYTSKEQQILFELEVSNDGHRHCYRYIGAIIK